MNTQAFAPADVDIIEMSKLNDEINWLVAFVNHQLDEGSHHLAMGRKYPVKFEYGDFAHSYAHLAYWRDCAEDIAVLFREQGWVVECSNPSAWMKDEQQPWLTFSVSTQ